MESTDTAPEPVAPAPPPVNLWRAVHSAQKAVRPVAKADTAKVEKDGRTLYTYKFASTEDMMHAGREALLEAGVVAQRTHYTVRRGEAGPEVLSYFRLIHVESGEFENYDPVGMPITGRNAPDKLLAGALTFAWSYWLRDVLCIPRKDDADPDRRDDSQARDGYSAPPQEATRRVTKSGGGGKSSKSNKRSKSAPPAEDNAAVSEARTAMVKAAKALVAAHDSAGKPDVDVFKIAGDAALGGKRWSKDDPHTIEEYNVARQAFDEARAKVEAESESDPPAVDDVPEVCPACGFSDGKHDDGCPEVPAS